MLAKLIDLYFSPVSVIVHSIWFTTWFACGGDVSLLTNIVSLEAIYSCVLIGMAQKAHHERTRRHFIHHLRKLDGSD